MSRKSPLLIALLLVASLLLAACGGSTPAPEAAATSTTAPVAVQPTTAPKNTIAPKASATAAPATEEAREEDTPVSSDGLRQIQDVESIRTFRQRTQISASGDAFEEEAGLFATVTMEVAYVREPEEAYQITMQFPEEAGEEGMGSIGIIQIGTRSFVNFGGDAWMESSGEQTPIDLSEVTVLDLTSLGANLDDLDEVGREEVNGRSTTHYRGDREVLAALNSVEGSDFSGVEAAQLDVWIDREENFLVKMEMTAEGIGMNPDAPEAEGSMSVMVEIYDINSDDIVIEAPDTGGDLGESLGIDLQLPENATVDFAMAGMTSISFTDATTAEVAAFIRDAMESAGYELDESSSAADFGIYVFTLGDRTVSVTVTESDGTVSLIIMQEQE